MRLFFFVLVVATVLGGFIGGELTDTTFTITGAAVGGIGTAAVLLGLGAYFDSQERKRRDKDLPPEVRAVFDRLTKQEGLRSAARSAPAHGQSRPQPAKSASLDLESTIRDLVAQDAAAAARGEELPRRLIPHHAIKRDIAIAAYRRDFEGASQQLAKMNWTEEERHRRRSEIKKTFEQYLTGVNRLGPEDLQELISTMKRTRTDFAELEKHVRDSNPIYRIVGPL